VNLQPLFPEPILEQEYLEPGYSGHSNDVWRVKTAGEEVVVRLCKLQSDPDDEFWWGCHRLFGVDPRRVFNLEPLNRELSRLSPIPVPQVLRKGRLEDRDCIVVEYLPGRRVESFIGQPDALMESLGVSLARIHQKEYAECGSPLGEVRFPAEELHPRMAEVMREMVVRFYGEEAAVKDALEPICRMALDLPPPRAGALVMMDLDVSQFLAEGDRLTGMVDTEGFVIAPREMDFISLETLLDPAGASAFAKGYRTVAPLPQLSEVRAAYRYWLLLIQFYGAVPFEPWMNRPELF
jgi:aminoglycoside phosphotransferase (APT) family kinase protein